MQKRVAGVNVKLFIIPVIVLTVFVIIVCVLFFYYVDSRYWSSRKISETDSIHLRLERIEIEKANVFFSYKEEKVYLHVKNNRRYTPNSFVNFIQKGDSIAKDVGTDTLKVIRENEIYYWTIFSE